MNYKYLKILPLFPPLLGLLTLVSITYPLANEAIATNEEYTEINSTFNDSTYNLVAYYPGKDQRDELFTFPFVEHVSFFYRYSATLVASNNQSAMSEVLFSDSMGETNISQFVSTRVVDTQTTTSVAYIDIDRTIANQLNIQAGDNITLAFTLANSPTINLTVRTIYLKDSMFDKRGGVSFVNFSPMLQEVMANLLGDRIRYYVALIQSSQPSITHTSMDEAYVPLGKALSRGSFTSDQEYSDYLELFTSRKYPNDTQTKSFLQANMITTLNFDLENYQESVENIITIRIIFSILLFLILGSLIIIFSNFLTRDIFDQSYLKRIQSQLLPFSLLMIIFFGVYSSFIFFILQQSANITLVLSSILVFVSFGFFPILFFEFSRFFLPMIIKFAYSIKKRL
jgi:hypothetical protein